MEIPPRTPQKTSKANELVNRPRLKFRRSKEHGMSIADAESKGQHLNANSAFSATTSGPQPRTSLSRFLFWHPFFFALICMAKL